MAFQQPREWKQLERHPLSAEYKDLAGQRWQDLLGSMRKHGFLDGHEIILHDGKILEGWQRQQACLETGIKPRYKSVPKGISPEDYVEAANDPRRHETPEEAETRVAMRRERVARALAE